MCTNEMYLVSTRHKENADVRGKDAQSIWGQSNRDIKIRRIGEHLLFYSCQNITLQGYCTIREFLEALYELGALHKEENESSNIEGEYTFFGNTVGPQVERHSIDHSNNMVLHIPSNRAKIGIDLHFRTEFYHIVDVIIGLVQIGVLKLIKGDVLTYENHIRRTRLTDFENNWTL